MPPSISMLYGMDTGNEGIIFLKFFHTVSIRTYLSKANLCISKSDQGTYYLFLFTDGWTAGWKVPGSWEPD
jgi:hypothetical protein